MMHLGNGDTENRHHASVIFLIRMCLRVKIVLIVSWIPIQSSMYRAV